MAGANQKNVALPDVHALLAPGRLEIIRPAIPDEPSGHRNALRGQEMKRAAQIIRPPPIPNAQLPNQCVEFLRTHHPVGLPFHQLVRLRIHARNICRSPRARLTQTG